MKQALDRSDWDDVEKFAHTLKGSSATIGAGELAEICHQLQASVQAKNLGRASERLMELENRFALVKGKLSELLT